MIAFVGKSGGFKSYEGSFSRNHGLQFSLPTQEDFKIFQWIRGIPDPW